MRERVSKAEAVRARRATFAPYFVIEEERPIEATVRTLTRSLRK